ncbi:MAG: DUF3164 family protein [Desulfobacterales bacterium]|nr:DUF3164 family protein [Desulfobacterales bacterium]
MAEKDKEGRWIDGSGNPIPPKYIDGIDKKRDQLVVRSIKNALKLNERITTFKAKVFDDIESFLNYIEERYNVSERTKGGNKIYTDFSNTIKVEVKVTKHISFDERLSLAKSIIDECIKRWSETSHDNIRVLIEQAFIVDKKGNLDKDRILGLRKIKIKDKDWVKAMGIISDSIKIDGSKTYIQFYHKDKSDNWETIPIDIARC